MRRRVLVEPTSRLAVWSLRIVTLGLGVTAIAIPLARADWLDGFQGLTVMAIGFVIAALGLGIAVLAGVVIWITGYQGARYAVLAALISLAMLAGPAALGVIALGLPRINDISTDTQDPPQFDVVARARPRSANSSVYPRSFAERQRTAYPQVRSLDVDLAPNDLNEVVMEVVENHRWRVLDQVDYTGPAQEGRYEMVARSLLLGFRDDIVIRIRAVNGRARIDIRSASRYGTHDFGVNARRITELLDELRAGVRRAQRS
ncbi:MAG: DUF1499 domain-containing protein [Alphaproteobacteria bacterium]